MAAGSLRRAWCQKIVLTLAEPNLLEYYRNAETLRGEMAKVLLTERNKSSTEE